MAKPFQAVIFDLGGVVLTPGPLVCGDFCACDMLDAFSDMLGVFLADYQVAIRKYESDHNLAPHTIARLFATAGDASAFARLERGELTLDQVWGLGRCSNAL